MFSYWEILAIWYIQAQKAKNIICDYSEVKMSKDKNVQKVWRYKQVIYGNNGNKTKEFSLTAGARWCSNGGQPLG